MLFKKTIDDKLQVSGHDGTSGDEIAESVLTCIYHRRYLGRNRTIHVIQEFIAAHPEMDAVGLILNAAVFLSERAYARRQGGDRHDRRQDARRSVYAVCTGADRCRPY